MNTEYPYKLDKLENDFTSILELNNKIDNCKDFMKGKLMKLKEMHTTMSKSNNKLIFLFSLDSFYFQYKTFSMELDNLNKFDSMFKNRSYCDYYKLYKLMTKYINDNKDDLKINVDTNISIPVYKDLEPFYDYGVENIKKVHETMLYYIKNMYNSVIEKDQAIQEYATKAHAGYSISNFVNTLTHENNILKGQLDLYINYISFFHISQQKQINRLYKNYMEFDKEIESNLNSDHAFSFNDLMDMQKEDNKDEEIKQNENESEYVKDNIPEKQEPSENKELPSNEIKPLNEEDIPVFKELKEETPAAA
jgi:hypothetical protein